MENSREAIRVSEPNMKSNSLAVLLVGVLALSTLATAALSFTYVQSMRKLQKLQAHASVINQSRAMMHRLVAETIDYSKRNPAMEPILDSVGIKLQSDAVKAAP